MSHTVPARKDSIAVQGGITVFGTPPWFTPRSFGASSPGLTITGGSTICIRPGEDCTLERLLTGTYL